VTIWDATIWDATIWDAIIWDATIWDATIRNATMSDLATWHSYDHQDDLRVTRGSTAKGILFLTHNQHEVVLRDFEECRDHVR
jgi:primase-polymerase (primpol)-like protein